MELKDSTTTLSSLSSSNSPSKLHTGINFQVASKMLKRLNLQLKQPQLPQCCMPKTKHLLEQIPYFLSWIPSEHVVLWNTLNAISIPVHVTR